MIDLNDSLVAKVFSLYCQWLNSFGADPDSTYRPKDFIKYSTVIYDGRPKWHCMVISAGVGDEGGPARLFIELEYYSGTCDVATIFQQFDGDGSIVYDSGIVNAGNEALTKKREAHAKEVEEYLKAKGFK